MTTPEGARADARRILEPWRNVLGRGDQSLGRRLEEEFTEALSRAAQGAPADAAGAPRSDGDGTARLCRALYGREATPRDYIGGSEARMLHDAADRLAQGAQPVGALDHADRWGKLWGLQAERSVALYAALRKYGEHGMYCNSRRLERTPCDCGLDAALATPEPQARQPEGYWYPSLCGESDCKTWRDRDQEAKG